MKILIVEDNTSLKTSLNDLFKTQQWEVFTASSYEKALILIKKNTFDLHLIDILLPDNKGYELLKHFKSENSKFILMSALFNESSILKYIPDELKDSCLFMKKPLDIKQLLENIKETTEPPEETHSPKSLESFISDSQTFDTQQLIYMLFLAHKSNFSGDLELNLNNKQKYFIGFTNGFIIKVASENAQSFFGILLVEHGLSLQESIEKIVAEDDKSKFIGEKLVEQSLLSPHMLNFILKEQIKIRLTQIMSQLSFSVNIIENKNLEKISNTMVDFNTQDLIDWGIDSLKTKVKNSFLKTFYLENKYNVLKVTDSIQQINLINKEFIQAYNDLLKKIEGNITFEKLLKDSKELRKDMELIYFGILNSSIKIINTNQPQVDSKKSEEIIQNILQNKTGNLFQVFNIPWKSSKEEVEKRYKVLTRILHPDKIPSDSSAKVVDQYREAFQKVQESYKTLSNTNERENYLKKQEGESFLNILSSYEKGINLIKSGSFQEGLDLLIAIKNNNHTPGNALLYMIWAKIELTGDFYNKEQSGAFKRELELCPIDQRTSPLFWFVTGLYYKHSHNYQKALSLFKKTIQVQKNFREAHQEIITTKQKLKKSMKNKKASNSILSNLFTSKKSG